MKYGAFSPMKAAVFNLAEDKLTNEVLPGRVRLSVAGGEYTDRLRPTARATVMTSVCSAAWDELNQYIGEDRALVLPDMYIRPLKEIAP